MESSRKSSLWSEKPPKEHESSHPTRTLAPSSDVFDVYVIYQSCIDQFCVLLELDSRDTILREYQTLLLWGQECQKQLDTAFQISQRVGNIVSRLLQSISKTLRVLLCLTHDDSNTPGTSSSEISSESSDDDNNDQEEHDAERHGSKQNMIEERVYSEKEKDRFQALETRDLQRDAKKRVRSDSLRFWITPSVTLPTANGRFDTRLEDLRTYVQGLVDLKPSIRHPAQTTESRDTLQRVQKISTILSPFPKASVEAEESKASHQLAPFWRSQLRGRFRPSITNSVHPEQSVDSKSVSPPTLYWNPLLRKYIPRALCKVCLNLSKHAFQEEFDRSGRSPTTEVEAIRKSQEAGCAPCRVLWQGITELIGRSEGRVILEREYSNRTDDTSTLILSYFVGEDEENKKNIEFYTLEDKPSPWDALGPACQIFNNQSTLRAKQLLQDCSKNHARCWKGPRPLPKCVIDVDLSKEHLTLHKSARERARYAALGRFWDSKDDASIRSTISALSLEAKSIPMKRLPQAFQDAIIITRTLGLKYLWIDWLCMLQDYREGQEYRINRHYDQVSIQEVYRNADLTISAGEATNCFNGLFIPADRQVGSQVVSSPESSNPVYVRPTQLSIHKFRGKDGSHGQRFVHYASESVYHNVFSFQHWIMSRRVLRFGVGGLTLECDHEARCECHPGRAQPCFALQLHDPQQERRIAERSRYENREAPLDNWFALIELYSRRAVKGDWDHFVLARLAASAAPFAQETYLYGHWRDHHFRESLLWKSKRSSTGISSHARNTGGHTAPTWSWSSVDGEVAANVSPSDSSIRIRPDFRVLEFHDYPARSVPPYRHDPTAHVLVAGLIRELQIRKHGDRSVDLFEGRRYASDPSRCAFASLLGKHEQTFELELTVDVDAPGLEIAHNDVLHFILLTDRQGLVLKRKIAEGNIGYKRVAVFEILIEKDLVEWEAGAVMKSAMLI